MLKNILSLILITLTFAGFSQEEESESKASSTMGGEATLTFSNTGYGDYYAGGGLGSTTIQGLLNMFGNKVYDNGGQWENLLRVDYGVAKIENSYDDKFGKTSDVLDFTSKYGVPVNKSDKWFYTAAFNALSQLTDTRTAWEADNGQFQQLVGLNGENYGTKQSSFFSPGDLNLGVGFDFKPNNNFSAYISPATTKLRIVSNDDIAKSGLYGNEVNYDPNNQANILSFDNTRWEFGANAMANYQNQFLNDDMLTFSTGLKLFSNYLDNPQNVDVNWNTVTTLNPWKFITVSYTTDLAYDDNKSFTAYANGDLTPKVEKGIQFRNVLGIGLIHKFGDAK